mmetsp:Transcript_10781/g.29576  ORF Transcript_10781/g.29576 Transcript_10781/m.29576 type:complete len:243 (-) Transcript_10781:179-907(-)
MNCHVRARWLPARSCYSRPLCLLEMSCPSWACPHALPQPRLLCCRASCACCCWPAAAAAAPPSSRVAAGWAAQTRSPRPATLTLCRSCRTGWPGGRASVCSRLPQAAHAGPQTRLSHRRCTPGTAILAWQHCVPWMCLSGSGCGTQQGSRHSRPGSRLCRIAHTRSRCHHPHRTCAPRCASPAALASAWHTHRPAPAAAHGTALPSLACRSQPGWEAHPANRHTGGPACAPPAWVLSCSTPG